jgi:quercetin dioxygenase-like cupin family protein
MKKSLFLSLILALGTTVNAAPQVVTPDSLTWTDSKDLSGSKVAVLAGSPQKHEAFVARVKLPANFQVPLHTHAIVENDTVISGTLNIKVGTQDLVLHAGDFISIPAHVSHSSTTTEETVLQINGVGPWGMIYKK